ncbi:MAG: hypothetical protein ACODAQ_11835, partial [Phycisphaeraceae bacterium]
SGMVDRSSGLVSVDVTGFVATAGAHRMIRRPLIVAAVIGGLLSGLGCSEDPFEQYTVPKGSERIAEARSTDVPRQREQTPSADGEQRSDARSPGSSDAKGTTIDEEAAWVVPEGWRVLEASRPMRVATFVVDDQAGPVEVAVTRFAGDVGGVLANVNRWRGQLDMEPIGEADLDELLTRFERPGFKGYLLHLRGPRQHMLAAGIHEPGEDRTWFVRVVAAEAVARRVKREVFAFARSFGTAKASRDRASEHEERR